MRLNEQVEELAKFWNIYLGEANFCLIFNFLSFKKFSPFPKFPCDGFDMVLQLN